MKKVISMLLVITMFFTFACACNKEDDKPTPDIGKTQDVNEGRLLKEYIDINKTGKYMITTEMLLEDGTVIPVTITILGSTKKMLTLNMPLNDGTQLPISVIINGTKKILLFSSLRTYSEIGEQQLPELTSFLKGAYIQLNALSFVEEGTVEVSGVTYSYEDYTNPSNQQSSRFLFKDGKLVMKGVVSADGIASDYQKFDVSGNVTEDMFVIPTEYTNDPESVGQFVSQIDNPTS
ncbi:MAG: hypothetical protein EOM50_05830 [Erysipelotrichia bacterium]|nr:hypothetical protein [Erysipelotrichia bacterium]